MSENAQELELNEEEVNLYDDSVEEDVTLTKRCPNCGAVMTFNPSKKCLSCEHCGSEKEIDLNKFGEELNFERLLNAEEVWAEDLHAYVCNNCGAKEILKKNEISKTCSFCGTTNIVESNELSGTKPSAVLPFAIDKKDANSKVKEWAKRKKYAPRAFKQSMSVDKMNGVYLPTFTFDTVTATSYSGRLGKYYYVSKRVNGKTVQQRKIRWFNIHGNFDKNFDDIVVQASNTLTSKDVKQLAPFESKEAREYSSDFLAGFSAEHYTKDGVNCWSEAKSFARDKIKSGILSSYQYDVVGNLSINTTFNNITYKYMLLPIFVGNFTWKTKVFNFFVNGRNGKVAGKTPISAVKVGITVLIGLAVIGVIALSLYLQS